MYLNPHGKRMEDVFPISAATRYSPRFEKLIEFRRADLDQSEATKDVIETMSPMADDGTPEVHESKSCAGSLMSLHNMRYCQRRLVCL